MASNGVYSGGGIVPLPFGSFSLAGSPVDAGFTRDGLVHGLMTACDGIAQTRVNFVSMAGQEANTSGTGQVPTGLGRRWRQFNASPFGPFPLTIGADGTPYKLRTRIAGYSDSGGSVKIAIAISPTRPQVSSLELAIDSIMSCTTTSTTDGWKNALSNETSNAHLISVSAQQASEWRRPTSVPNAVSGSAFRSTEQVMVYAWAFGIYLTGEASQPVLTGLHIMEYFGG